MSDSDDNLQTLDESEPAQIDDRVNMEELVNTPYLDQDETEPEPSPSGDESEEEKEEEEEEEEEEVFTNMKGLNSSLNPTPVVTEPERSKSLTEPRPCRIAPDPPKQTQRAGTLSGSISSGPNKSAQSFSNAMNPGSAAITPNAKVTTPSTGKNPITPIMERIDTLNNGSTTDYRKKQDSSPPPYKPAPLLNGYLDKGRGNIKKGLKSLVWDRRYVDYIGNALKLSLSREESNCNGETIQPLDAMFVSVQADIYIRLDGKMGSVVFKAQNQIQALQWALFLGQHCKVAPAAEGYALKESGKKKIMEQRYLKLTAEGLLSWYTGENVTKPQGTIQIRGERVNQKKKYVHVEIENRTYNFEFLHDREATLWYNAIQWHSGRQKLENPSIPTRKK